MTWLPHFPMFVQEHEKTRNGDTTLPLAPSGYRVFVKKNKGKQWNHVILVDFSAFVQNMAENIIKIWPLQCNLNEKI